MIAIFLLTHCIHVGHLSRDAASKKLSVSINGALNFQAYREGIAEELQDSSWDVKDWITRPS